MTDTLHQRIRTDIERRILSGEWPPGHKIPFEHELMETYQCSRMTVNKVISGLAEAGLVDRRRRAGSFVARPSAESAILHIPDMPAEIGQRGGGYGYELLSRRLRRATREDAARLRAPGVPVLDLSSRHLARGVPFALEERLLNLAVVPEARDVDFTGEPPGTWLLHHVPWTQGEHRIRAAEADPAQADLLDIAPGRACLVVERRTWRGDDTITFVRLIYPGHLHEMVARFTPAR
jgi:GntR family histidine utilization transcriptional repressor